MIFGYLCQHCNGVSNEVTAIVLGEPMESYSLHLGYVCSDCEFKAVQQANKFWKTDKLRAYIDPLDRKTADLLNVGLALERVKSEMKDNAPKPHKKF